MLANLPGGTRRVQVTLPNGQKQYKRPEEVDLVQDEIILTKGGLPVIMRGKPGRKKQGTGLQPATPNIAEVVEAREEHLETSNLIRLLKLDPESDASIDAVILGLTEEATILEFERLEAQRLGKDGTGIAMKRSRVLKAISDVQLKRKSLTEGGVIDLDAPTFAALFQFILETFKGAMKSAGVRPEAVEQTFTSLVATLREDNWRSEAKAKMKDKVQ
jgi:hypothetical protein